jgi:hypothetical protein
MDLAALNKRGWNTVHAGEVSDVLLKANDLLVIRGMIVDGIFKNDATGRAVLRNHNDKVANKRKKK